jgi:hypothetical protein
LGARGTAARTPSTRAAGHVAHGPHSRAHGAAGAVTTTQQATRVRPSRSGNTHTPLLAPLPTRVQDPPDAQQQHTPDRSPWRAFVSRPRARRVQAGPLMLALVAGWTPHFGTCAGGQVMGNSELGEKFMAASKMMRRDIVFAASLYL